VSFRSLFEHATQGDGVACAIQERCLRVWAALTTGLIHSFDPDVVVFGGGVLASADVIVPYIQKHVTEYAWTPWGKVRIKPAQLGSRAALLGAIPLLTG
jgi:glucokinase